MGEKKQILSDIVVVRLGLIVLLVFFHSFAIYGGGWQRLYVPPYVGLYYWLDWLSYSFMLESFVFISGLLFGYQERKKGGIPLDKLLIKKAKRLLIPSFIFSVLYFFCFEYSGSIGWKNVYDWIIGIHHMWFLPMLFLCFLFVAVFRKWIDQFFNLAVAICIILSILSFLTLPLRLDKTMEYLPFFVVGYGIGFKDYQLSHISIKTWIIVVILFILFFMGFTILNPYLMEIKGNYTALIRCCIYSIVNIGRLIYSALGVLLVYMAMSKVKQKGIVLNRSLIKVSECCFGVYLIHQFILVYLYDYTSLPTIINYIWLPWLCFIIALLLSITLSLLINKLKIGRQLI